MELKTAEEALGKELSEVYRKEYQKLTDRDSDLLYMPATDKAKWWCSCGVMNLISQMHCRVCGASIADLSRIMWKDYLQGLYDAEHPEEAAARKEAEEAAAAEEAEAAAKAEEERLAAEKAAEEERLAAEKAAEEERLAAEKAAEEERLAAEKAAEEERLAAEKAAEEERLAAEKAAEEERLAAEKAAEEERLAAEAAAEEEPEPVEMPADIPEPEVEWEVDPAPEPEPELPDVDETIDLDETPIEPAIFEDDPEENTLNAAGFDDEPENTLDSSIPAEEPVMLTGSRPDEPEPEKLSIEKEDEPEMGKVISMDEDENEYKDTRLVGGPDESDYFDDPKAAPPAADSVVGLSSADIEEPDEPVAAEIPEVTFPEPEEETADELPTIEFPDASEPEPEMDLTPIDDHEPVHVSVPEPDTTMDLDLMTDIEPEPEPEPEIEPDDGLPRVELEEALEMPGFGEVETIEAQSEENSVEFLELPSDEKEEKPKEKKSLFGGLFGKKKDKKKEEKEPKVFTEMKLKEEPVPEIKPIPEPEPEPTAETKEIEIPEPEDISVPTDILESYEKAAEEIVSDEEPADEPEEIVFPTEDEFAKEAEPEELPEIVFPEAEPEVESVKFAGAAEPEEGPTVVTDEDGNKQILFPDKPSGESAFGDMDELDFPDATIPEAPMPDPEIPPVLPKIEFPEGPQQELVMNPEPENKEKARPFRNPGATEETSSGLVTSEVIEAADEANEQAPATEPAKAPKDDTEANESGRDMGRYAIIAAIIVVAAAILVVGFFVVRGIFGSTAAAGAVGTANASIAKLTESDIPTQEDFNKAIADYNEVPYDYKDEVEHADVLEKYKDVDLKTVRDIATRINDLKDDTPFADVIALEEECEKLTAQEKQFIDASKIEERKQLNDMEKTALKAVSNIRTLLGSAENYKVASVAVKDDTKMSMSYRMMISYSYVDDQGTLKENTTYISMMTESDDVAYQDAINSGNTDNYLRGTADRDAYNRCESDETELDTDKLMYYLN